MFYFHTCILIWFIQNGEITCKKDCLPDHELPCKHPQKHSGDCCKQCPDTKSKEDKKKRKDRRKSKRNGKGHKRRRHRKRCKDKAYKSELCIYFQIKFFKYNSVCWLLCAEIVYEPGTSICYVRPVISLRMRTGCKVFAVRLMTIWILGYIQNAMWRLSSDRADAQTVLSLRGSHMQSCRKYCVPAHSCESYAP